jgi:hypothetical protein
MSDMVVKCVLSTE